MTFLFVYGFTGMMSYRTESSSPETETSRASVLSCVDNTEEPSVLSLSRTNSGRHMATESLTGGDNVIRTYAKSPNYLPLACLAMLMNPVLGIPACICSLFSRKYRKEGDNRTSARFSKTALWLSIIAIASSIVLIIFIIVYVLVITPNIIRNIDGLSPSFDAIVQNSAEVPYSATTALRIL